MHSPPSPPSPQRFLSLSPWTPSLILSSGLSTGQFSSLCLYLTSLSRPLPPHTQAIGPGPFHAMGTLNSTQMNSDSMPSITTYLLRGSLSNRHFCPISMGGHLGGPSSSSLPLVHPNSPSVSHTPHTCPHAVTRSHTQEVGAAPSMIHGDLSSTTQSPFWKIGLLQALPVIGVKPTFHVSINTSQAPIMCQAECQPRRGGLR